MWIYKNQTITNINQVPSGATGFVYLIQTSDNKKYIGKKNLYTTRKRKFGKKELAKLKDKRKKKFEYVTKESDWITYTSSNDELNSDIKSGINFTKYILKFCYHKQQLTYYEAKFQFDYNVLENDNFYNNNILGSFYKKCIS